MSAPVLFNLVNVRKCKFFLQQVYWSYDPKITSKSNVLCENPKILPYICDIIMAINT